MRPRLSRPPPHPKAPLPRPANRSSASTAASPFRARRSSAPSAAARNNSMPGLEWVVDAWGCDPEAVACPDKLRRLFDRLIADLALRPVAPTQWHQFPGAGGVT